MRKLLLAVLLTVFIVTPVFSAEMIRDGMGSGYMAHVDSENHLHTTATTESMIAHRSHYDATAFGGGTPMLSITTTGGRVLYVRNDSTTHDLVISDMWWSWNGGNTSGVTVVAGIMVFDDGAPSGNYTASGLGVLNRKTTNTADVTVRYWNETGNGMTMASSGTEAFYWLNTQGHHHVDVKDAVILGVNDSLSINMQGMEPGEASVNFYGFMRARK